MHTISLLLLVGWHFRALAAPSRSRFPDKTLSFRANCHRRSVRVDSETSETLNYPLAGLHGKQAIVQRRKDAVYMRLSSGRRNVCEWRFMFPWILHEWTVSIPAKAIVILLRINSSIVPASTYTLYITINVYCTQWKNALMLLWNEFICVWSHCVLLKSNNIIRLVKDTRIGGGGALLTVSGESGARTHRNPLSPQHI